MNDILPIKLTNSEKESLSYIEEIRDSLDKQFVVKYNLLGKTQRLSIIYNHINTNGSIFMNNVIKEDKSDSLWTIIDDPIIRNI